MHRRNPHDGNAGSTRPPHAEQTPYFLQPIGVDIGLQQCELDQIVPNLSKPVLKPVAARADYQLAALLRHGLSIAAATTGFDRICVSLKH
jgi:hypothetical protein